MRLYDKRQYWRLYQGDMLDMLEAIEKNTIASIVTDPPYELNFMGKKWDNRGISFQIATWQRCFEVLKPGGYLLTFGGSRTFHRIATVIEDAGFEIRDTIMWLYGSGFPKSMNIGLAIDKKNGTPNKWQGWGSCLKPSFEPIIVARKPFKGSLTDNVIKNGVGGLNIDECRIATSENITNHSRSKEAVENNKFKWGKEQERHKLPGQMIGRFPANTILTYDENDYEEVCGAMLAFTKSGEKKLGVENKGDFRAYKAFGKYRKNYFPTSSGPASRYFYCAKASKKDRDEGLEIFEEKTAGELTNRKEGSAGLTAFAGSHAPKKNIHPTVKPTELMQYLIRLVTPNGGTVLDPFNGSGSTGKAVMYENKERNKNYKYIGIDACEEYLNISKARIEFAFAGDPTC